MAFVSLTEMKDHLRITTDDDDAMLAIYYGAAAEYITMLTGLADSIDPVPFAIKAACLLILSDFYENRLAAQADKLYPNGAVMRLLMPHRVWE